MNEEEKAFPIAYSIIIYKEVDMVEQLLRAIYRPQNYYCIHIDAKSDQIVEDAMGALATCFSNVFISSNAVEVNWAEYGVLEAEFMCMEDLWKYPNWKYFINLAGEEFPLKTNLEIVKILKLLGGANNIQSKMKEYVLVSDIIMSDVLKSPILLLKHSRNAYDVMFY